MQTVAICDDHWIEEENERVPIRVLLDTEPCYRCGAPASIYVRRQMPARSRATAPSPE